MLLVGVALFVVGEVVEVVDDGVGVVDELVVCFGEEESSLDGAAPDVSPSPELPLAAPLDPPLTSPPQDSGSVGAFIRSTFLPEQRAWIECSLGFDSKQSRRQQRPLSCGLY